MMWMRYICVYHCSVIHMQYGVFPLVQAARRGDLYLCDALLSHGANIDQALIVRISIICLLICSESWQQRRNTGEYLSCQAIIHEQHIGTALYFACVCNLEPMVHHLLEAGASLRSVSVGPNVKRRNYHDVLLDLGSHGTSIDWCCSLQASCNHRLLNTRRS